MEALIAIDMLFIEIRYMIWHDKLVLSLSYVPGTFQRDMLSQKYQKIVFQLSMKHGPMHPGHQKNS